MESLEDPRIFALEEDVTRKTRQISCLMDQRRGRIGEQEGVKITSGGEMLLERTRSLEGKGMMWLLNQTEGRNGSIWAQFCKMHGHIIRHLGYLCKQTSSLDPITTKKCHTLAERERETQRERERERERDTFWPGWEREMAMENTEAQRGAHRERGRMRQSER